MGTRLLLVAVAVMAAPAYGQEHSLLRRLAHGEAGAEDQWHSLSAEEQVGLLRAGLQVKDPRIQYLAARALDPHGLSLEEVRLQAAVLVSHAEWIRDPRAATPSWAEEITLPIGCPDLPGLWRTAASVADLPGAREQLVYYHRALLPEHIPTLVGQLERAGPEAFHALANTLRLVADYTSEHRPVAARGFLYALERLRRERKKEPRSRGEDLTIDPASKAAFVALAKAAWGFDRNGFSVKGAPSLVPPHAWLVRWAREVAWAKEDIPFLSQAMWRAENPIAKAWAIRRLGALGAREVLLELAEGEDSLAVPGAAELVRLGEPARFLELLAETDWALPSSLAWYATPVEARRRWLGGVLLSPWVTDLVPVARYELEAEHEVRVREEDLAWIGENLRNIDAHPARVADYFAQVYPKGLTATVAAGLARRLRDVRDEPESGPLLLAPLEVANRDALVRLLDHWAAKGQGWALLYLARLGEARHVPAMLAAWSDRDFEGWVLGRVRDPRVEQHLRKRAEAGYAPAVEALAIYYGLPDSLRMLLEDPTEAERRLVLKRDPVAAALHAVSADPAGAVPWRVARLGLARDERATAFLRTLQEQRQHCQYWAATAGLALAGDAQARREFGALMREGRIWLLDRLVDGQVLTLGGRPEWIDFWLSRVNTNCCLSYVAITVLTGIYPTIPLEHDGIVDYASKERFARAWLDAHAFRPSHILDGLVPVAKDG
ncbi:MAG: hypothetical protein ACYTDU_02130 [Planctomycetota bacterium]|jgi:hypothetical protein